MSTEKIVWNFISYLWFFVYLSNNFLSTPDIFIYHEYLIENRMIILKRKNWQLENGSLFVQENLLKLSGNSVIIGISGYILSFL